MSCGERNRHQREYRFHSKCPYVEIKARGGPACLFWDLMKIGWVPGVLVFTLYCWSNLALYPLELGRNLSVLSQGCYMPERIRRLLLVVVCAWSKKPLNTRAQL